MNEKKQPSSKGNRYSDSQKIEALAALNQAQAQAFALESAGRALLTCEWAWTPYPAVKQFQFAD